MQSAGIGPTAQTDGGEQTPPPLVGVVSSGPERPRTDTTGAPCEEFPAEVLLFQGRTLFGPVYDALLDLRVQQGRTEGNLPRREAQQEARRQIAEDVRAALRIASIYLSLPPLLRHRLVDSAEDMHSDPESFCRTSTD